MRPRVEVVAIEANSTMMDLYMLHQVGAEGRCACEGVRDHVLRRGMEKTVAPLLPVFWIYLCCD